ncbi:MAG: S-methyl-5-thioribose-1-phosphate isomerase [Pseudomonadota bacterium]
MRVGEHHFRSIWFDEDADEVRIIDQRWLPHEFRVVGLRGLDEFVIAIRDMWVRGAPLIGAATAYAIATEMRRSPDDGALQSACDALTTTRPTANNLHWATEEMGRLLTPLAQKDRAAAAFRRAAQICEDDVENNRRIGLHGLEIIRDIAIRRPSGAPVRILTHCNAGWIATVDWGTATSPIYHAVEAGIPVHVFVSETRPRNQGALLTAWEMAGHGVSHELVVDNAGGHLMQRGEIDMVIVGSDRTTAAGDVCNKIGTYLKALAAHDNQVPFYVALPSPTIDWAVTDGLDEIPVEQRADREVTHVHGKAADGSIGAVKISPEATPVQNPAFDVTPARLVTGLITERGLCPASAQGLAGLFPEAAPTPIA